MENKQDTFKEWMMETIPEYIEDIVNHGVDAGYPGLTYYRDTIRLYDDYEEEIWDALDEDYKDFGFKNAVQFIGSFNCADSIQDDTTFKNALTWYMAERTAREIVDNHEVPELENEEVSQ